MMLNAKHNIIESGSSTLIVIISYLISHFEIVKVITIRRILLNVYVSFIIHNQKETVNNNEVED